MFKPVLEQLPNSRAESIIKQLAENRVAAASCQSDSYSRFASRLAVIVARGVLVLMTALLSVSLFAQHAGHGVAGPAAHGNGLLANTETVPGDDAVLDSAPDSIALRFPERVRLVKLTLHTGNRDWIDIDFRYDPRPDQDFVWNLPGLQQASYYTADWAILGDNDELIRGSFSFAFGPDAEAPSAVRRAQELLLEQRYGDPSIRYVAPPPTQILLDQDQPEIDPPFTIQLDADGRR